MADFCRQCTKDLFGVDQSDFDGVIEQRVAEHGDFPAGQGMEVLCEGCGMTLVDQQGRCVSRACELHGAG